MSVVGADLGSLNTVIAVARNRGVDVITNEVSNRATPTLVGFGPKSRYLGETAKTQEISNSKNTVGSLTRLAGRSFNDPDVQIEQGFVSSPLVDVGGQVGAEITYMGKKERFSATQLLAGYLTKIKSTASNELKLPVADIVLACPAWFTDAQRRSIIDAADIAGLKLLRLVNDTTATALGYGITKLDLPGPDERPRRVVFVDIGHSDYTCSVVEFRKGELSVKATASDRHFGGRNFDKAIVDHFAKEFKEKFKIDVTSNAKARFRVLAACEKLKKILSANASAPLNIESVMEDIDVRGFLKREELEELVQPLLERVNQPLEQALAEAKVRPDDVDAIEMVGGCTRVPIIKAAVQAYFGKPLSFTLNQDEAVARGCAFSCAILSPVFRVRDFSVHDIVPYPIEFAWEKSPDIPDEDTALTVFHRGNVMPSTKILTFYRKQPFDLEARYARPEGLPGRASPWIGRFSVKGVRADERDDFMICKLKARINLHGVLNIEQGYYVEDQEVEEPAPDAKKEEEKKDENAMDVDGTKDAAAAAANGSADAAEKPPKPKMRKVKKQVRRGELPLASGTASMDQAAKDAAAEREHAMFVEDKLVADTEDKKNELEASIYETRAKIDDTWAEFASDEEKARLREKLEKTEDWLYDEGEDASKAVYTSKLEEIRAVAGPIVQRYNDKLEAERQARLKVEEERKAAQDAKRQAAEEEKRKAEEEKRKAEGGTAKDGEEADGKQDVSMEDAEGVKPDEGGEK